MRPSTFASGCVRLIETYKQVSFPVSCGYLNAVTAGPENGRVVILLHGFPEFWYGWNKQIQPLADAGLRVIVPDQRGYNLSSKPADVRNYVMSELTADVVAIADGIGAKKVLLAGHDWGAAVAWNTAMQHPDRVEKLAIVNVPHPAVMVWALRTRPRQMLRSWYMLFFQIPRLPELLLSRNNFQLCAQTLRRTSRAGAFSPDDLDLYREAWSQPGAITGMINWYRALFQDMPAPQALRRRVTVPTRILWGSRDRFLMREMASESLAYCDNGELFEFPEATHWLQHEEPVKVNDLLIDFFGRARL
jgi:epoxide hydrolase 4